MNQGGAAEKIFGGWQISGIQRYQTGTPLVVFNNNSNFSSDFLDLVGFQGGVRPNLTGAPDLVRMRQLMSGQQRIEIG